MSSWNQEVEIILFCDFFAVQEADQRIGNPFGRQVGVAHEQILVTAQKAEFDDDGRRLWIDALEGVIFGHVVRHCVGVVRQAGDGRVVGIHAGEQPVGGIGDDSV